MLRVMIREMIKITRANNKMLVFNFHLQNFPDSFSELFLMAASPIDLSAAEAPQEYTEVVIDKVGYRISYQSFFIHPRQGPVTDRTPPERLRFSERQSVSYFAQLVCNSVGCDKNYVPRPLVPRKTGVSCENGPPLFPGDSDNLPV